MKAHCSIASPLFGAGGRHLPTFWRGRLISSPNPLTLEAGTQLGPYRVLAPIGAGGMGEVYRARDTKLDRDIALKILPPDVASVETLRRFEKEARAASSLNHPNIVAIYDVGRHESIAYIAMELIDGETLRSTMSEPMPPKEALRVAAKIAEVLASAHERGVIHRDLKPENVMISRDGYIKLLDFGLAKVRTIFASGDKTEEQTTAGHVFGTTSYMSPEQAAGKAMDFRSDQFSLGVILYEMLMAKRPFDRATGAETLTAIIREDAPPIAIADDALRNDLQQVLNRCLAKAPVERYASTKDLAHDLREIRNRLTLASNSGRRSARSMRIEAPRVPVIGSVAGVLLIAVLTAMMWQRGTTPPPAPAAEVTKALAILPFRDMSSTGDGQLFSDGISEMISGRIAQARGLRVIAPFDEPVRRRGANLLLRGSVQRVGEQLRVSYELVDAASGNRVGGDMVTAPSSEVFTLEDFVADGVLQSLNLNRAHRAPRSAANSLSGSDQKTYTEAIGLLQRINDVDSLDRAIRSLESLLANARDAANVNGTLGRALLRKYALTRNRELVDQAAIYAERAVQLDSAEPEANLTLGELRRISGRLPEALSSFQRALSLQQNSVEARLGLGDTYAAMGRGADADRLYRQALQTAPDLPDVYGHYGSFCYAQARYPEAVQLFRKQSQLLPDAPRAYANLGAAEQALGHYEAAMAAYQRSIAIRPTAGGFSNLGTCQYFLGRFDEAAVSYERAVALTPNNYIVWANLGDAYRWSVASRPKAAAAYAKAETLARDAVNVNPRDALAHAVAASTMARGGSFAAAQPEMKLALTLEPTNPNILIQAAIIANLRGDRSIAIGWLDRAIASGYSRSDAARDPEFVNLRSDPRFTATTDLRKRSA
jgi:tetratricopeptide (TPR) repeat protein/tRNA A-37 threonylcarbamoyl transferase component Bud32